MSIANSSHELACFNRQPDGGDERIRLRERARQTRAPGDTYTCVCVCVCARARVDVRVSHARAHSCSSRVHSFRDVSVGEPSSGGTTMAPSTYPAVVARGAGIVGAFVVVVVGGNDEADSFVVAVSFASVAAIPSAMALSARFSN